MRKIVLSPHCEKELIKLLRKNSELESRINKVFRILEANILDSSLKIHKLHGKFSMLYACSITHEYRLVFSYDKEFVYLHTIGSHDEVY